MLSPFFSSLSQIIVSEIGDKTFFITAILGMTYSIGIVFMGSYSAAIVMTLLSCFMGYLLPQILSPTLSNALVSAMFIYFGQKQLWEIWRNDEDSDDEEDEAKEEIKKLRLKKEASNVEVFRKVLLLNTLGEWGDRSQFTTVALAIEETQSIILGALLGHFICCGIAVLGGKMISQKIPEKHIKFIGGILFLLFGIQNALKLLCLLSLKSYNFIILENYLEKRVI